MSERIEREVMGVGVGPVSSCSTETVSRCKRTRSMAANEQFIDLDKEKESKPPLGLKLKKSASLLDLIQTKLSRPHLSPGPEPKQKHKHVEETQKLNNGLRRSPTSLEKLKASNFHASYLRIGSWECMSRYEGDLVAKCYFAKRKLVWEVLQGGLKSKIEIQWADISALRASYQSNRHDILEIELNKLPQFFRETNPQPRKHTMWQLSSDFTRGQAVRCRRHLIQFDEGTLERHFEKLLQFDCRLLMLSKAGFPSSNSLYFETNGEVQPFYREHEGCRFYGALQQNGATASYGVNNICNSICHTHVNQNYVNPLEMRVPFQQGNLNGQFLNVNNLCMLSPGSVTDGSLNEETGASEYAELYNSRNMEHASHLDSSILDYRNGNLNMSSDLVLTNQLDNFCQEYSQISENGDSSMDMQLLDIARHLLGDQDSDCGNQDGQTFFPNRNLFNPAPYTDGTPIPSQGDVLNMAYLLAAQKQ